MHECFTRPRLCPQEPKLCIGILNPFHSNNKHFKANILLIQLINGIHTSGFATEKFSDSEASNVSSAVAGFCERGRHDPMLTILRQQPIWKVFILTHEHWPTIRKTLNIGESYHVHY